VGGDCVQEFGDIGNWMFKSTQELIKDQLKIQNLSKLNEVIPGIEKIINQWDILMDEQQILIPPKLVSPYIDLGKEAKKIYSEVIAGKGYRTRSKILTEIIQKREILLNEIKNYVNSNISNKFIATMEICQSLKRSRKEFIIDMIKQDQGIIKWRTASRIKEKNFLTLLKEEYNKKLESFGVQISSINIDVAGFNIVCKSKPEINFYAKNSDFTLEFGWLIFNDYLNEECSTALLINQCKISDEKSLDYVINGLLVLLKKNIIKIKEYNIEKNEVFLFNSALKMYVRKTLIEFAEKYKVLIFEPQTSLINQLQSKFVNENNKMTVEDFDKYKEAEREVRKEFKNSKFL
jgi:hypothetical protein